MVKSPQDARFGKNDGMRQPHKYARIERERRFLIDRFPGDDVVQLRQITDRYIDGTHLRLREQIDDGGPRYTSSHRKFRRGQAERNRD